MTWFNAAEHNPELSGGSLPIGKNPVQITGSSVRATNDQSGGILVLNCVVIDGPNRGATGNLLLNIWNKNDQSKEIAGRQLSAICHAVNTHQLDAKPEGVELWNKPFVVEIAQQKDSQYTQLVGVYDMAGNAPKRGAASAGPAAAPGPQFTQQAPQFNQPVGAVAPAGQPSWSGGTPAANAPAAQPIQGQPSWNQAPAPATAPQGNAPSWSQQPPNSGGQPSWAGPR